MQRLIPSLKIIILGVVAYRAIRILLGFCHPQALRVTAPAALRESFLLAKVQSKGWRGETRPNCLLQEAHKHIVSPALDFGYQSSKALLRQQTFPAASRPQLALASMTVNIKSLKAWQYGDKTLIKFPTPFSVIYRPHHA